MKKVIKAIAIFIGGMFAGYMLSNHLYSVADKMHDDDFDPEYNGEWVDDYLKADDNDDLNESETD